MKNQRNSKSFCFLILIGFHVLICNKCLGSNDPITAQINTLDSLLWKVKVDEAEVIANNILEQLVTKDKVAIDRKLFVLNKLIGIYIKKEEEDSATKIALEVYDLSKKYNRPDYTYKALLAMSLIYEINEKYKDEDIHLIEAELLAKKHQLDTIFSAYNVRRASYYNRLKNNNEAAKYALVALELSKKYHQLRDYTDANLLLGIYHSKTNLDLCVSHFQNAAHYAKIWGDYELLLLCFGNIAHQYTYFNQIDKALAYSDSSFMYKDSARLSYSMIPYIDRQKIYEKTGQFDSSLYYMKLYHEKYEEIKFFENRLKLTQIVEEYENDKKENIIKNQFIGILLICTILLIIVVTSILLLMKNNKIKKQNQIINLQVNDLQKLLAQQEILFNELQHRVKNNLQHVISILEFQKESVNFTNVEELIRENQNRIHSMSLLHRKLSSFENLNTVNLHDYIYQLSTLVIDSYSSEYKNIDLKIDCEDVSISINKAHSIGLITVELISNSIKHAFSDTKASQIYLNIDFNASTGDYSLIYKDNGSGFDFNAEKHKGLGVEIIKGLIDQLNGRYEVNSDNGFTLKLYF